MGEVTPPLVIDAISPAFFRLSISPYYVQRLRLNQSYVVVSFFTLACIGVAVSSPFHLDILFPDLFIRYGTAVLGVLGLLSRPLNVRLPRTL